MKTIRDQVMFSVIVLVTALSGRLVAQSGPTEFVSFSAFMDRTTTANSSEYLAQPEGHVQDANALEQMRQHVLAMYRGVEVTHSFVLDASHFDCIPIDQQPAVRIYGLKTIASAPPATFARISKPNAAESASKPALQLDPDSPFDQFGNSVHCEEHTVPIRRITLETMAHFPTLRDFFSKQTDGSLQAPAQPQAASVHKYSITQQNVNNLGGNSNLNVWSPYVNTSAGEVFSLSQEWYVGGSGSGLQTEEVGWVVYPAMFNDEKPHFFIFSTPDNYATGCWNNSCGDFVQVAGNGILGASLTSSTFGGTQYDISAEYYLYNGNWWLSYQGTWIGYYPGSKYRGGQNTRYAQIMQFGTESVGSTLWAPEGSGQWSSKGFGYAAYQRNLWYFNTSASAVWDTLTGYQPSPYCYTISGPYSSSASGWTRYFFEGGPGGSGC